MVYVANSKTLKFFLEEAIAIIGYGLLFMILSFPNLDA